MKDSRPVSTEVITEVWVPVKLPPGVRIKFVIGHCDRTGLTYDLEVCGPVRPVDWEPARAAEERDG